MAIYWAFITGGVLDGCRRVFRERKMKVFQGGVYEDSFESRDSRS